MCVVMFDEAIVIVEGEPKQTWDMIVWNDLEFSLVNWSNLLNEIVAL